jgi:hypothetical protein
MKTKKSNSVYNFDNLYGDVIAPFFTNIADNRASNSSYSQTDALRSGFAMYSLKSPSLYSFRKRSEAEESNLTSIFGIEKIPSDNGLRKILDQVDSDTLGGGFKELYQFLKKNNYLPQYRYWSGNLVVSIDGVEHFCSKEVSCPHCMVRNHRGGSKSYYHSMLSAAIVNPDHREVLILDNEPIVKQDGAKKNDCERNAAKRLLHNLQKSHSETGMVLVMDALYSCGPIIRQVSENEKWRYIIGITPDGHTSLFQQFDELNEANKVNWHSIKTKDDHYTFGYVNKVTLNQSNKDITCNMLYCVWRNKKGEEKVFTWVTNITLTKRNVKKVMRMGRSRWKIENEVFNTLKNQGYQFEHNFGHGQKNLCTNFVYLMMLAFCVDQIQQFASTLFQQILADLKTRIKFWEVIRAVFKIRLCDSMKELHLYIVEMYQIKLE